MSRFRAAPLRARARDVTLTVKPSDHLPGTCLEPKIPSGVEPGNDVSPRVLTSRRPCPRAEGTNWLKDRWRGNTAGDVKRPGCLTYKQPGGVCLPAGPVVVGVAIVVAARESHAQDCGLQRSGDETEDQSDLHADLI